MRYQAKIVGVGVALALGLAPTAASAAPGDTTVTFNVSSGALTVSVPASADLGAAAPGATNTGTLGNVTVNDLRAAANPAWTAVVKSTDFITGAGGPGMVVAAPSVQYTAGATTGTTGNGTFTPGAPGPLNTATQLTAYTHAGGSGNNSATWNPTLVVTLALDNVVGQYTGTVTHSVS
jgi:hypothetical protein